MRSRLEASFAQWLDADPTHEWSYEGRCYASPDGQYLPDFYVYFGWRDDWEYCEVKPPNADFAAALARMHIILASEPQARLGVWTSHTDLGFFRVDWCLPDIACGQCERPKFLAGYER